MDRCMGGSSMLVPEKSDPWCGLSPEALGTCLEGWNSLGEAGARFFFVGRSHFTLVSGRLPCSGFGPHLTLFPVGPVLCEGSWRPPAHGDLIQVVRKLTGENLWPLRGCGWVCPPSGLTFHSEII